MKFTTATIVTVATATATTQAFTTPLGVGKLQSTTTTTLFNIRPKTEKAQNLAFGWDGTTALGM